MSARRVCVEQAARGAFARAFKADVSAPKPSDAQRFADEVGEMIGARALSALGLARKAGAAVAGFEKVREALSAGRAAILLSADDASDGGAEKLARLAGASPVIRAFSTARQSAALGLDKAVHVAVLKGSHAERLLKEIARLRGFREIAGGQAS